MAAHHTPQLLALVGAAALLALFLSVAAAQPTFGQIPPDTPIIRFIPAENGVVDLNTTEFADQILGSAEPWVLTLYSPICKFCQEMLPELNNASAQLEKYGVRVGRVSTLSNPHLATHLDAVTVPSTYFYRPPRMTSTKRPPPPPPPAAEDTPAAAPEDTPADLPADPPAGAFKDAFEDLPEDTDEDTDELESFDEDIEEDDNSIREEEVTIPPPDFDAMPKRSAPVRFRRNIVQTDKEIIKFVLRSLGKETSIIGSHSQLSAFAKAPARHELPQRPTHALVLAARRQPAAIWRALSAQFSSVMPFAYLSVRSLDAVGDIDSVLMVEVLDGSLVTVDEWLAGDSAADTLLFFSVDADSSGPIVAHVYSGPASTTTIRDHILEMLGTTIDNLLDLSIVTTD